MKFGWMGLERVEVGWAGSAGKMLRNEDCMVGLKPSSLRHALRLGLDPTSDARGISNDGSVHLEGVHTWFTSFTVSPFSEHSQPDVTSDHPTKETLRFFPTSFLVMLMRWASMKTFTRAEWSQANEINCFNCFSLFYLPRLLSFLWACWSSGNDQYLSSTRETWNVIEWNG